MPFSSRYLAVVFGLSLCAALPSWAASDESQRRQTLFEMDKTAALADFDSAQQQACLQAFRSRYSAHYTPSGALAFNEALSLIGYDRLFWKGERSSHRGLIFTGMVRDEAGTEAGHVLCYYAITDYRLAFQSAYMLPKRLDDARAATLTSLSSKE